MSEVFVARQPIFNRALDVAGYELLFRAGSGSAEAMISSAEGATATVVLNSMTELGLEQVVGSTVAWVNVSREFMLGGLARAIPAGSVMLEILEDEVVDAALVDEVIELKRQGHSFALDDFKYDPSWEPLLRLADVVKLDLLALGRERFNRQVERLRPHGLTLLAEKIETHEEYKFCRGLGCELFQGYFFCKPEMVKGRRVDANRLALLELLAALQDPAVDLSDLERMIANDIGLSNRLLRYINSAFFGLRQQIRSIKQALALLGVERIKHWAALSVFASIGDKPAELTLTALVRARFCELAAEARGVREKGSELFTLGLFSVIDALMDAPMPEVLEKLPFAQETCDALCTHEGEDGALLDCLSALEAGDFDAAQALNPDAGELYLASLTWANQAADPLKEEAVAA